MSIISDLARDVFPRVQPLRRLSGAMLCVALVLLSGCDKPEEVQSVSGGGGAIMAVHHTKWAINRFSVNGRSGLDIIGPWQGGGGGCCFGVPPEWQPGMTVEVTWETGVGYSLDFPGYQDREKYFAWKAKIEAQKRQHSQIVSLPDYTGQHTCGITVHFLPCEKIKVTTSCYEYGHPDYPITDPMTPKDLSKMEEPEVCQK